MGRWSSEGLFTGLFRVPPKASMEKLVKSSWKYDAALTTRRSQVQYDPFRCTLLKSVNGKGMKILPGPWASRSVVDRSLGMREAVGSKPETFLSKEGFKAHLQETVCKHIL